MISIECPQCAHPFTKQKPPKVLPCGHSMCPNCLYDCVEQKGYYICRNCAQKFDPNLLNYSFPVNFLFFQMQQKMQKILRDKQWQEGTPKDKNGEDSIGLLLRIEEQCLYTFCQRKKFERDGVYELYCSQECQNNHEELQEIF